MSLDTNIRNLVVRAASSDKSMRTLLNGNVTDLASLHTAVKTNLVAAINETFDAIGGAGATIDDSGTSGLSVWSSSKTDAMIDAAVAALVNGAGTTLDTLNELAAALGNDPNFAATLAAQMGKRVAVDAEQTFTSGEKAQARTNIGAGTSNLAIGTAAGTAADAAALVASLAGKEPTITAGTTAQYLRGDKTMATLNAAAVGLSNVSNTSDAAKPVSTAQATAIGAKYTKPGTGIPQTDLATGVQTSLGKADSALQSAPVASVAGKTGAVTLVKADVGLSNVDNTTDLNKPISTATQTALNGKGTSNLAIGTTAGTAADAAAVGPTDTDYVALFNAGL